MAAFRYEPLGADGETIRVLRIEPLSYNSEHVSCSLENVPLRSVETKYIALSHIWGTDYRTVKILMNGQSHHVTPQLWHFLVLAAQRIPNQCLWIDAICIDQSRLAEKREQIPMMGQIYSRAAMLIAWVWGPLDGVGGDSRITATRREAAATIADVSCDILQGITQNTEVSQALLRLIFHNYWSRVWIVQEIRLTHDREFWWEGQRISARRLQAIATAIATHAAYKSSARLPQDLRTLNRLVWQSLSEGVNDGPDAERPTLLDHTQTIASDGSREFASADDRLDLAETVVKHKNFKCGILADHVFGFLGIVKHGHLFYVEYGMLESDFLVQTWKLSCNMDYRTLAALGQVLGVDWSSKLMHRVHVPWYTELDMVLRSLQEIAPNLRQVILDLKLFKPSSTKANGIMSKASWLSKLYRTDATRRTQAPHVQLLAEIIRLVKSQQHEHTLKVPSLGMYYIVQCTSKDQPGHAKIRKLLKMTCESKSNKPGGENLVVKVAIVEHKAGSQHVPSIYLHGNALLSLVCSSISGSTSSGQPQAPKTLLVKLDPKTFLELLRMSDNTHPVWQGAQLWTLPMPPAGSATA